MKNRLEQDERQRRVDEVRKEGVYFHTSLSNRSDKPLLREDADALIERNMGAFVGDDPSVLDTEATIKFFKGKF